jgi:predicted nucleic acid-binding Zn ribbon protein
VTGRRTGEGADGADEPASLDPADPADPANSGIDRWGTSRRFASRPIPLADSLAGVVSALRHEERTGNVGAGVAAIGGVFGRWEEAVGAAVAAHVQPVKLDGTTLIVEVDDPAWATQLRFLEATLRDRLAEVAGAVIDKVEVRVRRR